ncbi:hypothetical protein BDU57DRAFT_534534 [Ampelomyces quisqualis]|uniref:Uncharacterized protein n=1 Tax=Ampelomyces quisqualis TaxID=50730 RepID=A0A6A5R0Z2_AMPQU|nr:hypothetical protein BDU57DRAFT_534534 [Ampelomyces quisqualis]
MSPQKQNQQALKTTTFLAGLLGSIDTDRSASKSPASSVSSPATACTASAAAKLSSCSNNISPSSARAVATKSPTDDSPYTLDYGSASCHRFIAQPRTKSSSARSHQSTGDFYRPSSGSLSPRDSNRRHKIGSGRGGDSYRPGYADRTTSLSRSCHVRQVASCPVTQKNTAATNPSSTIGVPSIQAQKVSTPTPQTGAIRPVEEIIADLLKPHPKLVTQTHAEADKTAEPQRRKADVYRPSQRIRPQPNRLHHRHEYFSWSNIRLLQEVNLRRLKPDPDDPMYLVDILMINDSKFFEMWEEFRSLSVYDLLKEADLWHIEVDFAKRWNQRILLSEIVDKMAQHAVSQHNELLRTEKIARKSTQAKIVGTTTSPSVDSCRSKVTKGSHRLKDRTMLRKVTEAEVEQEYQAAAAKHDREDSTKKVVSQYKSKKTRDATSKKTKSESLGYKSGHKLEKYDKGRPIPALSETKLDKRRCSKQDFRDTSTRRERRNAQVIKKCPLPVGRDEYSEGKFSKTPTPTHLEKIFDATDTPSSGKVDNQHSSTELDVVNKHATKEQATPERKKLVSTGAVRSDKATLETFSAPNNVATVLPKSFSKRKDRGSDDDEDADSSEEAPLMEVRQTKKRKSSQSSPKVEEDMGTQKAGAIKQPKMKGIPKFERVQGIAYTKLTDGSYKAAQRIQKLGKMKKAKAEPNKPRKNYIKG